MVAKSRPNIDLSETPAFAAILERMLERDKADREHWQQLASQVSTLSVVLQSVQNETTTLVKLAERQQVYNEEQLRLTHASAEHGRTFDRAFTEIKQERIEREALRVALVAERARERQELTASIDALSAKIGNLTERADTSTGSMSGVKLTLAALIPVLLSMVGLVYWNLDERIDATEIARDALSDRISALEKKP